MLLYRRRLRYTARRDLPGRPYWVIL